MGFLKISQNSTKKTCDWVFFNKASGLRCTTLFKKIHQHTCFPMNFVKFLRTTFFTEHLRWLLVKQKVKSNKKSIFYFSHTCEVWEVWVPNLLVFKSGWNHGFQYIFCKNNISQFFINTIWLITLRNCHESDVVFLKVKHFSDIAKLGKKLDPVFLTAEILYWVGRNNFIFRNAMKGQSRI